MPQRRLRDIVGDQKLLYVGSGEKVADAVRLMQAHRVSCVPVLESGELLGIFTSSTLIRAVLDAGRDPARTVVDDVMVAEPVTLDADNYGFEAIRLMSEHGIHHVIVRNCGDHDYAVVTIHDFPAHEIIAFDDELEFERRLWEEM